MNSSSRGRRLDPAIRLFLPTLALLMLLAAHAGTAQTTVTQPAAADSPVGTDSAEQGSTEQASSEADDDVESDDEPVLPIAISDRIQVTGIRAGDEVPVTKRNIDRQEIERLSQGQDVPALLQYTPSMTWYSDSGTGSNYSYFSLRGVQQTRINITLDGAPLNDPAEHAVYFNNFNDLTSIVDSIQVQRGVGTSSVGSPSYGGSVNFASRPLAAESGLSARLAFGSYDTQSASMAYESGLLAGGVALSGRVSYSDTAGYRDRSGSEHLTLFFNAEWQRERSTLKLVSFSGHEKSELAFLAVDPDMLRDNPRFNPLAPEERDDFRQNFAQLQYTRALGGDQLLTASFYYNGADGYFRLWDDPVAQSNLLEFGVDQYFIGSRVSLSRTGERLSTTFGVHFNDFRGGHTLHTRGGQALDIEAAPIYSNTGLKSEASGFGKAEYRLGSWLLFGDLQLRWAEFDYQGDIDLGSVSWTFLDPKIGVRYHLSPAASLYASVGRARREPTRTDLLAGEDNATVPHDLETVDPEEVVDFEAGYNYSSARLALQATAYAMEFRDEIALTGELSEIGLPLRRNVDRSYRRGLELDLRWIFARHWALTHSANLSRNRIREWTQFYDIFDADGNFVGTRSIEHRDVPPLLTPEWVFNQGIEWSHVNTELGLTGRYVATSHLDNTDNDDFRAPSYFNLDLRAAITLDQWPSLGRPRLSLHVNNLLGDVDQYPSGYSYLFLERDGAGRETIGGIPFYYPLATRNFVLTLEFGL